MRIGFVYRQDVDPTDVFDDQPARRLHVTRNRTAEGLGLPLPAGRLVVWSNSARLVRLVNINGSDGRVLSAGVASDLGAFPRFDETRQHVTVHAGLGSGQPNSVIIADTLGSGRRELGPDRRDSVRSSRFASSRMDWCSSLGGVPVSPHPPACRCGKSRPTTA